MQPHQLGDVVVDLAPSESPTHHSPKKSFSYSVDEYIMVKVIHRKLEEI